MSDGIQELWQLIGAIFAISSLLTGAAIAYVRQSSKASETTLTQAMTEFRTEFRDMRKHVDESIKNVYTNVNETNDRTLSSITKQLSDVKEFIYDLNKKVDDQNEHIHRIEKASLSSKLELHDTFVNRREFQDLYDTIKAMKSGPH